MTDSQRFALALTECRSEYNALVATINGLPDTEQPTTEQQGRMTELRSTAAGLETRIAAATETEQRAEQNAPEHTVDSAERERRELRSRSRLGRWFEAAISGRVLSGAEAETAAAYGCDNGAIPLEMFERRRAASGATETRAVTPAPSDHGREPGADCAGAFRPQCRQLFGNRDAHREHWRRRVSGAINERYRRAGSEIGDGAGNGGRVHGDHGAAAAHNRRASLHKGRFRAPGRHGRGAEDEPGKRPE